jgi:hypothetical protein
MSEQPNPLSPLEVNQLLIEIVRQWAWALFKVLLIVSFGIRISYFVIVGK